MSVATPPQVTQPFATSGTANTIPVASQIGITPGAASFTDGFPPLTATPIGSGGIPPSVGDMNGILKMISAHVAYLQSGAGYPYNSAISTAIGGYNIGATLLAADNSGYWINLVNNNTTNPDTGGAGWASLYQYGIATVSGLAGSNVTLTATQYGKSVIILAGALTANINIVFPALVAQWVVVNNTTGSFTITCKTASGTGTQVAQGGWATSALIQGDGTNINSQTGSFVTSAGLTAALASYVTSASLATTLNSYVTTASLASQLSAYETTAAHNASLANYLTTAAAAAGYVSNSALSASLANYLLSSTAASTYVSNSLLSTTLSAYVTSSALSTSLSAYASKVYANGTQNTNTTGVSFLAPSGGAGVKVIAGITGSLAQGTNTITFPFGGFATACVCVQLTPVGGSATYTVFSFTKTSFLMSTGAGEQFCYTAYGY